ncbi:MAG: hypothetical protein R2824_17045 [Saprospiraceae bacterium]|nr:hypothetical protein [Lewinella sp.]
MSRKDYLSGGSPELEGRSSDRHFSNFFRLTQVAAIAVFMGRAWQHLRWDAPYRDLFWDENWMGGIVRFLGYPDWQAYVTDPSNDAAMQWLVKGMGWFYVLCTIAAVFIIKIGKPARWLVRIGGITLIFLAALYTKEKFFSIGQFFEYSLQWSTPFFLAAFVQQTTITKRQEIWLKIAVALTFICHGLYAIGYYPRPELFQTMVINILGVNNDQAWQFLNLAGLMDFIAAIALFIRWKKIYLIALLYLTFWGFMTTIARPWAFVYWEFLGSGLAQWLHESLYRLPHVLMPFALLYWYWSERK